jgi:hypothetical protein
MATFIDMDEDILDSTASVLVCPVICEKGSMGIGMVDGLARRFTSRWPVLRRLHSACLSKGYLGIGRTIIVHPDLERGPRVMLFPVKEGFWSEVDEGDIVSGLASAMPQLVEIKARSVAFPAIGCSVLFRDLKWGDVRPLIIQAMSAVDIVVTLYGHEVG